MAGFFFETLFHVASVIWNLNELIEHPTWENLGWLLLDVGCTILPIVPAIGGVVRLAKAADKAMDAGKATDKLLDAGKGVDKLLDAGKSAEKSLDFDAGFRGSEDFSMFFRVMDKGGYSGKIVRHHLLPRQFEAFFNAHDIPNIHAKDYILRMDENVHKIIHGNRIGPLKTQYFKYNQEWDKWIRANGDAKPLDIISEMRSLMGYFGVG